MTWRRPKKTSSTRCEGELRLGTGCRVLGTCVPSNSTASPQVVPTRSLKLAPLLRSALVCLVFSTWLHGMDRAWKVFELDVEQGPRRRNSGKNAGRHQPPPQAHFTSVKPAIPTRGVFRWSHPTDVCCLSHTSPLTQTAGEKQCTLCVKI